MMKHKQTTSASGDYYNTRREMELLPKGTRERLAAQDADLTTLRAERDALAAQVAALQGERATMSAALSATGMGPETEDDLARMVGVVAQSRVDWIALAHQEEWNTTLAKDAAKVWKRAAKRLWREEIIDCAAAMSLLEQMPHFAEHVRADEFANAPDLPTTPEAPAINEVY